MKVNKILFSFLSLCAITTSLTSCGGSSSGGEETAKTTITFWNPITGPDASYMQDLVTQFNEEHAGEIYVKADAQAEDNHYKRIYTSFSDNSTADLCLVHKSRLASFQRANKLRDMTSLLEGIGVSEEQYVGDTYTACEFDGKMYAAPFDVLPTVLYYNRNLIPEGYTEEDILSEDFTIDKMIEMMKAAYQDAPIDSKKKYGISFNYSYTEQMFLSLLNQQGKTAVNAEAPTEPTFACDEGYKAAEAIRKLPMAKTDSGKKVASESGADHLNIYVQGRALFTIDGIWSAPQACKDTERLDTGVALLPKVNESAERKVAADGHCFVTFTNNSVSTEKDAAIGTFIDYLIENSGTWCQGGKVAATSKVVEDPNYQSLEWGYLSQRLEDCVSPVKTYTYDTIIDPIGSYVAKLCEGTLTDVKSAIDAAADEARQAAEKL